MADYEVKTRRFSRVEYEKLIDLGIFQPGEPIELIGGELMVAEPQGAAHYTAIRKTVRALEAAFGPGWDVRSQGPIGLRRGVRTRTRRGRGPWGPGRLSQRAPLPSRPHRRGGRVEPRH